MKHKYYLMRDGDEETREYEVERLNETTVLVTLPDGTSQTLDLRAFGNLINFLTPEGRSLDVHVARGKDNTYLVTTPDIDQTFTVLNERRMRMAKASGAHNATGGPQLTSPMAGKVIMVKVEEGASVETGDVVIIIEAMKMENDLKAHRSGTVSRIAVNPGDTVEIGDVLVEIESPEEA